MRQVVPKSVRFEVFKRDSFRCQYCGADAPQVVLHVDHIEPVSGGGTNEITNLITACEACNLGKSDVPLSDQAAVVKAKNQLDELQERREQLELIMEWRKGLRNLDGEVVQKLADYWQERAPGWATNENGKLTLEKLSKRFSVDDICNAMDTAASAYLKFEPDGKVTGDSWELAFTKVPGICRVEKASKSNPDIKQLFYIRGILRNRIPGYFDEVRALQYLKNARSWDIDLEELSEIARRIKNLSQFTQAVGGAIGRQMKLYGENGDE